ncbi:nucleic acid-binding protein [Delitschia confertaspora ATCC 74209]|uniref:Nucleic acid-binding protein n=1 Tax=Delitschia confertaspora ATCC 74209 TaxID=1513339 RepID=A0A9P4JZP2_9PLEO|nr:nucleic acid-binding protein [Delitschia confertaspora ATCC 74209]
MGPPKRNLIATIQSTLSPPAELTSSQTIARVVKAEGKNLYTVELPSKDQILVELEAKFRSTIWMKRGSYVLIDRKGVNIDAARENRLKGEIVGVVGDERGWRGMTYWPKEFVKKRDTYADGSDDEESTVGKMPPSEDEEEEEGEEEK